MRSNPLAVRERLREIQESIALIDEWSGFAKCPDDFLLSAQSVMAFNACVMRLQVIGENVGKLLKDESHPLDGYDHIPWRAIYNMRNIISHEYCNIDEVLVFQVIREELPKLDETVKSIEKSLAC